jgi:hydroxymethylbilane synthase
MSPPSSGAVLRVGTRGSALALRQSNLAIDALRVCASKRGIDLRAEVVTIKTTGDAVTDRPYHEIGPKGLFARELQGALARGEIDVAVHSLKDLAADEPDGIMIAAVLPRGEIKDAFVGRDGETLDDLADGSVVGTSSLRRTALLAMARPGLRVAPFRGNVDTRLDKIARGEVDGAVLAGAGLVRLGREDAVTQWLDPETFLPAPGQGAIAIEAATERVAADLSWFRDADHAATRAAVDAERAFMGAMEGGCQVPLGAWGRIDAGNGVPAREPGPQARLVLTGFLALPDGSESVRAEVASAGESPHETGLRLSQALHEKGAADLLRRLRGD